MAHIQERRRISNMELARRSGVTRETIIRWRQGRTPGIANFDAALQAMGFRLVIQPIERGPAR